MSPNKLPWNVPVSLSGIPEGGKRFELVADEPTRAQIATVAGLRSLSRFHATFDVTRHGADGLRVNGKVSASVGQNCVVTLDPLDNDVSEEIDIVFAPSRAGAAAKNGDEDIETVQGDDSETLTGDTVDLGALATEFMMLGIDPYPRKPGVTFEPPAAEDETPHPFAALAALKKGQDDQK